MGRYALLLSYDGTGFSGWWRQPEKRTIAGELDAAFARIGERSAEPVGASRTDAGVHARGQVAHIDLERHWDAGRLANALTAQLPADLSCLGVAAVASDWHAAHDVRSKTYRYCIDVGAAIDPFHAARFAWRPPTVPDLGALRKTAELVSGSRDWVAFRRRGEYREDTRCRVTACSWRRQGRLLVCSITASGFIYRLARSLVGGMVAVANGACTLADWRQALDGKTTEASRQQAPALGLCLERIRYPTEPNWIAPERNRR